MMKVILQWRLYSETVLFCRQFWKTK